MTARRRVSAAAGLVLVASGCAKPAPQPVQAPVRDRVVLAADPEAGEVGRVTVTTPGGQVELADRGASTTVTSGGVPTPPSTMSDAEIQQRFGAALAVQPPAARRFELYFETGGDALTADSKAQVPDVLAAVKARVAPEVSVLR